VPLLGVVGSPSNTMLSGPRPTSLPIGILIHPAVWLQQLFGYNRYGPKIGGVPPFWGVGGGSPSNTMWPGIRPTFIPSGILIHPAIFHSTPMSQTDRQRSCSIGRTVLQTVA